MGGIHHAVKAFPGEQVLHVLLCQPSGGNGEVFLLLQHRLPILRGHAGVNPDALAGEQRGQLPAFAGAGKNTNLIHPGSLWG